MAGIGSEHARDVREAVRIVASDPDLGPATLSDAPAMPNLLKDLLPDAPREKNLLVAAAEARLAAMMLDHVYQGIDATSAIRLAAASFGANTHFTTDACDWVSTELAVALDLADGLAVSRSQLPPGDITTRRPADGGGSASAALLACGIQLLFVFESVWQHVAHDGDSLGVGLPLGVAGAVLLTGGSAATLLRARASGQAVSPVSRVPR